MQSQLDPHFGARRPYKVPRSEFHLTLSLLALWCMVIFTLAAVSLNSVGSLLEAM